MAQTSSSDFSSETTPDTKQPKQFLERRHEINQAEPVVGLPYAGKDLTFTMQPLTLTLDSGGNSRGLPVVRFFRSRQSFRERIIL
jgi:hypothetical protein